MEKWLLEKLPPEQRRAFLSLETDIKKLRIELFELINKKTSIYDDSKIQANIQTLQSKMDKIEKKYDSQIGLIASYGVWQKNNKAFFDKLATMDDGFGIFTDLLTVIYKTLQDSPYITEIEKTKKWQDRLKDIDDWIIERNKLHDKIATTEEEYKKISQVIKQ